MADVQDSPRNKQTGRSNLAKMDNQDSANDENTPKQEGSRFPPITNTNGNQRNGARGGLPRENDDTEQDDEVEYERIRQSGRERLMDLAQPKEPKIEWWTSVGPKVMWGTQDMLWPIPDGAKQAEATPRLAELATPKKNFQTGNQVNRPLFYYSPGRPSMIWDVSPLARNTDCSPRVASLSNPKRTHPNYKEDERQFYYSCGRSSPICQVKRGAISCGDRAYTSKLAEPKSPHRDFQPNRQVETIIPYSATRASASERLQLLSGPKQRPEGPFRHPQWPVTPAAKNASATSRSLELARPKGLTEGYLQPREVEWIVTRAAKRGNATTRIQQLSLPIVRASMDHVQFNPDAFLVKESALKGVIPRRVEELAIPIQRG